MITLKTTNRELVELINGLFNVQELQGVRFGLVVSKNIRILQQELKDLEEASKATPEFISLSQQEAVEQLERDNMELVEGRRTQLEEIDKMMAEECEVRLHEVAEDILPESISAMQITNIDKLITE